MRYRDCYFCHSNENDPYASENGYFLVKCQKCGLLYVNPIPEEREINTAHSIGIHRGTKAVNVTGSFNKRKIPHYLSILNDFFDDHSILYDKSWLDIGCGHGEFIAAINQFSKDKAITRGLEPNFFKQKSAIKMGLDVSYFDLDKHSVHYDFISSLNVFSHLPDPPKSLTLWKYLLEPGGLLFMETGDTANLDSKDHFRPFYLPDHLSFASEKIVVNILEQLEFKILRIKKYPFIEITPFSVLKEFLKIFWPNQISGIRYFFKHRLYKTAVMYILARKEK